MSLPVYLVESIGMPRNHHAIFVQIDNENGSGQLFHVRGNIQEGMTFETREEPRPESSAEYTGKTHLGWVSKSELDRLGEICASNPAPKKQFNGVKRIEPNAPLRRCQEWVKETVNMLQQEGILEPKGEREDLA